ncbi:hypothetical protein EDC14_100941 [Hydrogenispora ethanolica]|uniref:Uncharacterized protein n=1 Tax=Hydrogenispora ethanolica TaxID=1082276 RepID=A0A4R1RWA2_HYDET|nr:hypothetical protein [Hydrogenispora ethanolica]TCL70724.1 hypothetical protein EDC14_100941 [Hydrogenispora ethanolica]
MDKAESNGFFGYFFAAKKVTRRRNRGPKEQASKSFPLCIPPDLLLAVCQDMFLFFFSSLYVHGLDYFLLCES